MQKKLDIKAIIGLGNPGSKFDKTRHNIGFRIVDALSGRYHGSWRKRDNMELSEITLHGKKILLVKPQTFMNLSGQVMPFLTKQGITPDNLLVVHDEIELPFGVIKYKSGGSAKGHNGLKSIMSSIGSDFHRIRFGVDRPLDRDDVPHYVLAKFRESEDLIITALEEAVDMIEDVIGEIV